MDIDKLLTDNTDEIIAVTVVVTYAVSWFIKQPMPTEPLMIVLGYYFGKKKVE